MYYHEYLANILVAKSLASAKSTLDNIPEHDRELVMDEVFKILRGIKHPKPYGDAVTYNAPRVKAKLQKRGKTYYLWLNNRLVEYSSLGEALYAFEIEKILRGKEALITTVFTGYPLFRKSFFVKSLVPEYHAPKEVKRCTFADDVI